MNIYDIYRLVIPHFRGRRMKMFRRLLSPKPDTAILDVGGIHLFWKDEEALGHITCVNPRIAKGATDLGNCEYVEADGRALPFPDNSYEIVFSNSVIEHLETAEDQERFASEIRRVGRSYWVQTPNKWFFVEPHLIAPFIHLLPLRLQRRLVRWFSAWGLLERPSQDEIDALLNSLRPLTHKDMTRLFPDATIYAERFLGFKKSLIAVRRME